MPRADAVRSCILGGSSAVFDPAIFRGAGTAAADAQPSLTLHSDVSYGGRSVGRARTNVPNLALACALCASQHRDVRGPAGAISGQRPNRISTCSAEKSMGAGVHLDPGQYT